MCVLQRRKPSAASLSTHAELKWGELWGGFANSPWQQRSEFAVRWLMWSCSGDLSCGGHAHLQCLFSWSTWLPERMAPSSPGLQPAWYPVGGAHTAHGPAPGSSQFSCCCFKREDPKPGVFDTKELICLTDLMKMFFSTGRLLHMRPSPHILL